MDNKYLELEKKRVDFVSTFPIDKIGGINIDDYVIGKRSKSSFCYRIENELKSLGDMHGSGAKKFGIYFNKKNNRYEYPKKFGKGEFAFNNVKSAIIDLLEDGKTYNLEDIEKNPLSNMFKGKILSTYFPNKFLSIFANNLLIYYLNKLEIPYNQKDSEIYKRDLLLKFKNDDPKMEKWNVFDFTEYLYHNFGGPSKIKGRF